MQKIPPANSADSTQPKIQGLSNPAKTLFVTPSQRLLQYVREALEAQHQKNVLSRGFLADAIPWYSCGDFAVLGPALGGPAMTLAVRPFLAAGTTQVIFLGYVGSLETTSTIAQYLFPLSITSLNAPQQMQSVPSLQNTPLHSLYPAAAQIQLSSVLTIDDPLQCSPTARRQWIAQDYYYVEMELAYLAGLLPQYPYTLLPLLIISDGYNADDQHESRISSKAVRDASKRLCSHIVEFCHTRSAQESV